MSEPKCSFSWQEGDDRAVLSGPGLRLAFARMGDRWTHRLEFPHGGGIEVARAVECEPERDDPLRVISPLYQELHHHDLAEGPGLCLLLTGRLFHHHFSAAVSLRGEPAQPESLTLDFDVADRCRAPLESLAATYVVGLDSGALVEADPGRIAWSPEGPVRGRLELLAEPPGRLALAEAGRNATRVQVMAMIEPGTFTQRLRYGWRWTGATDPTR